VVSQSIQRAAPSTQTNDGRNNQNVANEAPAPLPPSPAPLSVAAPRTSPGTTPGGGTLLSATSIAGWDASALAPIERALAATLGPLAKLLVREAARSCTDMASLTARVAEHIPDARERAAFIAHATWTGGTRTVASTPTLSTTPPVTDPNGPLPSGVISHALRVLTDHMGPIARIVIKRAALKAGSTDEFHALIVEEAAEGPERKRLLKRLRAS